MSLNFFLICISFNLFNLSLQYYDMKFGFIYMNYYNNSDCAGRPTHNISYDVEDEDTDKLYFLKKDSVIVSYPFSFDFFSTTIYYSNNENEEEDDEDEEEEENSRKGILCNGLCFALKKDDEILIEKEVVFAPSYIERLQASKYYSCVYNNIIKNATIKIERYSDKSCKTRIQGEHSTFRGNQSCWDVTSNYSYRPLYYEDDKDRIYYHAYNQSNCESEMFAPFIFNKHYFQCNSKCHQQLDNNNYYYTCQFTEGKYLNALNVIYLYLFIYIISNIF